MTANVDFLFDVASPTAYLAWTQLPGLVERTGAHVNFTPVLLAGLYRGSGNVAPTESASKIAYIMLDCRRYARKFGAPFRPNPHFPVNSLMAMRAIAGAQRDGDFAEVMTAAFRALWVEGRKLDDPKALEAMAEAAGVGVARLAHWVGDDGVKAQLRANTEHAVARGAFGVPTFFVGDEIFFGQDRLDWVEAALSC